MRRIIFEMVLILLIFLPFPLYFLPGAVDFSAPISSQMISYIVLGVPQIGVLLYILSLQKPSWSAFGLRKPRRSSIGWAFIGLGGAFITMSIVSMASLLLPEVVRSNLIRQSPIAITTPLEIPLMIVFCITVGYREELLFRSYLIPRLGELGVKPAPAVAATSLLFGLAHWNQGILGVAVTAVIGASFGVIFILRKDLHAVAWGHALYDIGVFLLLMLKPYLEQIYGRWM